MYETLLTNEECAKAVDMGDFYRVPADNRGLNYDKYFKEGDEFVYVHVEAPDECGHHFEKDNKIKL